MTDQTSQPRATGSLTLEQFFDDVDLGHNLADQRGLNQGALDLVYLYAGQALVRGDYEDARRGFLFLSLHAFNRSEYWYGLGISFQGLERPQNALSAFLIALMWGADARICFEIGRCYMQFGEAELARNAFLNARLHEDADEEMNRRIDTYLDVLNEKDGASENVE